MLIFQGTFRLFLFSRKLEGASIKMLLKCVFRQCFPRLSMNNSKPRIRLGRFDIDGLFTRGGYAVAVILLKRIKSQSQSNMWKIFLTAVVLKLLNRKSWYGTGWIAILSYQIPVSISSKRWTLLIKCKLVYSKMNEPNNITMFKVNSSLLIGGCTCLKYSFDLILDLGLWEQPTSVW